MRGAQGCACSTTGEERDSTLSLAPRDIPRSTARVIRVDALAPPAGCSFVSHADCVSMKCKSLPVETSNYSPIEIAVSYSWTCERSPRTVISSAKVYACRSFFRERRPAETTLLGPRRSPRARGASARAARPPPHRTPGRRRTLDQQSRAARPRRRSRPPYHRER